MAEGQFASRFFRHFGKQSKMHLCCSEVVGADIFRQRHPQGGVKVQAFVLGLDGPTCLIESDFNVAAKGQGRFNAHHSQQCGPDFHM